MGDIMLIPNVVIDYFEYIRSKYNKFVKSKFFEEIPEEVKNYVEKYSIDVVKLNVVIRRGKLEYPLLCPVCGKIIENVKRDYCSDECAKIVSYKKREETNLKKYGTKVASKNKVVIDKMKKTNLERYGTTCTLQNEKVLEKIKNTSLKKYGVEHPVQSKECIEKRKNTNRKKYGGNAPLCSSEIKDKMMNTVRNRYGVSNVFQDEDVITRSKNKMLTKYGVPYYTMSDTYKENNNEEAYERLSKLKNIKLISTKEEFLSGNRIYECSYCHSTFSDNRNYQITCPECAKQLYSNKEKELLNYVKSIYSGTIIENDRTVLSGKELDIYIPDKRVAIEFDGAYWHSNLFVNKNYHLDKTVKCQEKNIRLLHIYEGTWERKKDIYKSVIASALGIYNQKIYARNCMVRNLSYLEYKHFLEENHIQDGVTSSIRLGLFYEKELVSAIGFGKSRFKKDEYELHRFCTKLNTQVIGGFSKLIKHSGVKEFISYVDRALFTGEGYLKIGFKLLGYTNPSYYYYTIKNYQNLENRMKFQKHKLNNLLENYDESLSEKENMKNNGYLWIYDCGNIKMKFSKKIS